MVPRVERFGPFEIVRLLGRGGMAEAFVARRPEGDSAPLVVKRVRPDHAQREEYQRRFVLEAQVASRLRHPNLVRFVEFGQVGQSQYLAMELVRGRSLQRLLEHLFERETPPPVEVALSIGAGILSGLAEMHAVTDEAGQPRPMLHRDVTPANVIVATEGRPVIIDFGITKDLFGPSLTLPGKVIGTARYMAPEHRRAEYLDARADVFSASVILAELLLGRHPWPPLSSIKELLRVTFDPPELTDAERARLTPELCAVLFQGLDCDRERRFSDARAMLSALQALPIFPTDGEARVAAWAAGLGVPLDEELVEPVVDLLRGAQASPGPPAQAPAQENPAERGAQVLALPPLPPRRDSSLGDVGTLDLVAEAAVPSRRMWAWSLLGLGGVVLVGAVVAFLLSH